MPYCIQCGSTASYTIPKGDNRERIVCDNNAKDDSSTNNCGYIHYQNPNTVCGALVVYEGKVLLCKRAIEPQYGTWTLPAGFMEIGESMMEGAKRETWEEAEAITTDMKLYCLFDLPALGQIHVMYLANLKQAENGKLFGIGIETLETALVAEEDIDWNTISFETVKRTLKHYFSDRKQQLAKGYLTEDFSHFPLYQETVEKSPQWDV